MTLLAAASAVAVFAVAGPTAVVAVGLLNGTINSRYLLFGTRRDGTRYFSPERVQLLIASIVIAAMYFADALELAHTGQLPDIPAGWLAVLGGSQALYLTGKAIAMLRGSASDSNP